MTWSVKALLVHLGGARRCAMPILLGTTPASADAARDPGFSGYSSLATAAPVKIEIYEPTIPIPANPSSRSSSATPRSRPTPAARWAAPAGCGQATRWVRAPDLRRAARAAPAAVREQLPRPGELRPALGCGPAGRRAVPGCGDAPAPARTGRSRRRASRPTARSRTAPAGQRRRGRRGRRPGWGRRRWRRTGSARPAGRAAVCRALPARPEDRPADRPA